MKRLLLLLCLPLLLPITQGCRRPSHETIIVNPGDHAERERLERERERLERERHRH